MNPTRVSIFALSICSWANAYSLSNTDLLLPRAFPPLLGPGFGDAPAIPSISVTKPTLLEPTSTSLLHTSSTSTTTGSGSSKLSSSTEPLGIFPTHPIIGSPRPLSTSSYSIPSVILPSTTYTYTPATISPANESSTMSPGEASQWKVIGIGVITIVVITVVVLSIVFFDTWTRFLFGRNKQTEGIEDMMPDWEKRSWEYKLASEDGHRYPTHEKTPPAQTHAQDQSSSIVPTSQPSPFAYEPEFSNQWPTAIAPMPPPTAYQPDPDPHPLEPFFRRPSIRSIHIKSPSLLPY
ncbi:hypothetical protein D9758_002190 [Tetrapyrgos nigripes]|uniref:Uncharacterized protein n=1 Tax=Tetrapyrgos nigripes TaxID=182062 RepID=A0A8H5GNX9_9AGAR|nr:hypothetical protein D9758_002190 [Tetrapyrgos nigripes]